MKYLVKNGFGSVMTCRRDCLPSQIPPQYLYKIKTYSKQRSKEARFLHTDVAVKETHAQDVKQSYQRSHVSFQYTLSFNISTFNSLSQCKLKT